MRISPTSNDSLSDLTRSEKIILDTNLFKDNRNMLVFFFVLFLFFFCFFLSSKIFQFYALNKNNFYVLDFSSREGCSIWIRNFFLPPLSRLVLHSSVSKA